MDLKFTLVAALTAAALVGCKDETKTNTSPTPPANTTPGMDTGPGANAAEKADSAASTVMAEADKLIAEAKQYINDKKWNEASSVIEKLKALREKLSPEYQTKVDELVKLFDTVKATAGDLPTNLPGLGK